MLLLLSLWLLLLQLLLLLLLLTLLSFEDERMARPADNFAVDSKDLPRRVPAWDWD